MKAAVIIMLAGACAAQGQVNNGFETGDLTGFNALVGSPTYTSVVSQTGEGWPAYDDWCARLSAGGLSMAEAESAMDIAEGRLAKLVADLGGQDIEGGDYNVLEVDKPAGTYYFNYLYEGGDVNNDNYADHAFVVNGVGEITVLASGIDGGGAGFWKGETVEHPGGSIFFVCANGGDTASDPSLYIDETFWSPSGNLSFQSGLTEWTIQDNGANNALVVAQTGDGESPTDGSLMARLVAGELSQDQAESAMKLDSGSLEDLYDAIGGTGDAGAGDYLIMSQTLPVGQVTFDWLVEEGDVFYLDFADHAFVVNGAGEITVVYDSTDGPSTSWSETSVDHPGGELFVVVANGGDTGNPPIMYVDNVRVGPTIVDTTPSWDDLTPAPQIFGDGDVETIGQTFVAEGGALEQVTFFVKDAVDQQIEFEAYIAEWNGQTAVGEPVFASDVLTTDGTWNGYQQLVIDTPGARLEEGTTYVAFLTVSNTMSTGGGAQFGFTDTDVMSGHMVYNNNGANFDQLFGFGWGVIFADLAIELTYGDASERVAPKVNASTPGVTSNNWPWNANSSFRYQQVYRADQLGGAAGIVDRFLYRPDNAVGKKFTDKAVNCQIWLGHTDRDPGELSEVFDDNFSADKTLVHDGPMSLSSAGLGGFDIEVNVLDTFQYNGEDNLLLEIIIPDSSNSGLGGFDATAAQVIGPGAGETPWSDRVTALDANASSGNIDKWDGLATQFVFLPPEAPCVADCDGNGSLNILDFVCYQFLFEQGDVAEADCNGDGVLNILDFVCFQGEFQAGCP